MHISTVQSSISGENNDDPAFVIIEPILSVLVISYLVSLINHLGLAVSMVGSRGPRDSDFILIFL